MCLRASKCLRQKRCAADAQFRPFGTVKRLVWGGVGALGRGFGVLCVHSRDLRQLHWSVQSPTGTLLPYPLSLACVRAWVMGRGALVCLEGLKGHVQRLSGLNLCVCFYGCPPPDDDKVKAWWVVGEALIGVNLYLCFSLSAIGVLLQDGPQCRHTACLP